MYFSFKNNNFGHYCKIFDIFLIDLCLTFTLDDVRELCFPQVLLNKIESIDI